MQAHRIYDKNNKLIGRVYLFVDYDPKIRDKDAFVDYVVKSIRNKPGIGFAGYETKKYLNQGLRWGLFGSEQCSALPNYKFDAQKILLIIKHTLVKCHNILPSYVTNVFVFPSFSSFVKEKMGGTCGWSQWKNTVHIVINPTAKSWNKALENSICHEYSHSVIRNYHKWDTLLDGMIFEGFAETFVESVIAGGKGITVQGVSKKECEKYFTLLKTRLHSKSVKLDDEVFLAGKKYPHWLGYHMGYYIVKLFLKKNKQLSWKEIIKLTPKEVLKQSGFK